MINGCQVIVKALFKRLLPKCILVNFQLPASFRWSLGHNHTCNLPASLLDTFCPGLVQIEDTFYLLSVYNNSSQ